jgi:general stress protein 26
VERITHFPDHSFHKNLPWFIKILLKLKEAAMQKGCHIKIQFIILLFIIPFSDLFAQTDQQRDVSRDSLLIYARTIIDSSDSWLLVTVDETDKPRARIMSPFPPEEDWTIWLGTFPTSRKVKEIKKNPNVVVFYYDSKSYSYVNISGTAQLVNDSDMKAKYWKEGWKRYYPDRERDYILIQVTPRKLEVCSFKYELFWDENGIPPVVEFTVEEGE